MQCFKTSLFSLILFIFFIFTFSCTPSSKKITQTSTIDHKKSTIFIFQCDNALLYNDILDTFIILHKGTPQYIHKFTNRLTKVTEHPPHNHTINHVDSIIFQRNYHEDIHTLNQFISTKMVVKDGYSVPQLSYNDYKRQFLKNNSFLFLDSISPLLSLTPQSTSPVKQYSKIHDYSAKVKGDYLILIESMEWFNEAKKIQNNKNSIQSQNFLPPLSIGAVYRFNLKSSIWNLKTNKKIHSLDTTSTPFFGKERVFINQSTDFAIRTLTKQINTILINQ